MSEPIEYWGGCPVRECRQEGDDLIFVKPCPWCGGIHKRWAGPVKFTPGEWAGWRVGDCRITRIKRTLKLRYPLPGYEKGYFLKVVEVAGH